MPDLSLAKFLLSHEKCDISLVNSQNLTCFQVAMANYHGKYISSLIEIIFEHFPDCTCGTLDSFKYLLSPDHGIYTFMNCCSHSQCCKCLKYHASITPEYIVDSNTGNTALHQACKVVCPPIIRMFLQRQSYRHAMSEFPVNCVGQTPLHILAIGIKDQKAYLESKSKVYFLQEDYLPEFKKKLKMLGKYDWQMLQQFGINKKDERGNTALHYACEAQSVIMLNALASNQLCDFEVCNNADKLPLTIAQETGNQSFYLRVLIKFFESKGE